MDPYKLFSLATHNCVVTLSCKVIGNGKRSLMVATNPNGDRQCFVKVAGTHGHIWAPFGTILDDAGVKFDDSDYDGYSEGLFHERKLGIALVSKGHITPNHVLSKLPLESYKRTLENLYACQGMMIKIDLEPRCRRSNAPLTTESEIRRGILDSLYSEHS